MTKASCVFLAAALLLACSDNKGENGSTSSSSGASTANSTGAGASSGAGGMGGIGGADGPLKAFPEAEGFGSDTPGGRGGAIYVVTTLADSGPGSLREALLASEPRIIVFRVSGVIDLGEPIVLGEENSYVTVAGQTSPGGITIAGSGDIESYMNDFHDGVFRFLRFRGQDKYDNISFNTTHHLVIDHCDFSGATDEAFDITFASDVTVQWSTITNSNPSGQNYGMLFAYEPNANITFHHNFHAHHRGRCLADMHWGDGGPPPEGAIVEVRNNVVYNCAFEVPLWTDNFGLGTIEFNLVGNHFKAGPDTPDCCGMFRLTDSMEAYESDNLYGALPPFSNSGFTVVDQPFAAPPVTTSSADQAMDDVLVRAGAWPRDPMNERTIGEAEAGTGTLGKLDDPLIETGPEAPADDDLDGMPNDWELGEGLDPNDPADASADADNDGYTNVEEYLAGLARSLIPD